MTGESAQMPAAGKDSDLIAFPDGEPITATIHDTDPSNGSALVLADALVESMPP